MGAWHVHAKRQRVHHDGRFAWWLPTNPGPMRRAIEFHRILHRGIQASLVHVGRSTCRTYVPNLRDTQHASDKTAEECYNGCGTTVKEVDIKCQGFEPSVDDSCTRCIRVFDICCGIGTIEHHRHLVRLPLLHSQHSPSCLGTTVLPSKHYVWFPHQPHLLFWISDKHYL